ncbi:GNAT family N-acetyltransferase [Streptomyces sp. NPDC051219]|uniref:GNAT family N-acetyltransferase n=1 Tax=Streptomyces sp. NPDC051219 TaxID=3155283 RepID=UPI00342B4BDF
METDVRLESWSEGDFGLLRRNNASEMTAHLGGPESEEQLVARHQRYLNIEEAGTGRMFRIVLADTGEAAGAIGYWERVWQGETVYETGWGVLPEFQGRGIAVAAAKAVVGHAGSAGRHWQLHAFPSVGHAASNAVCRKAGFELVGVCTFEYPKGHFMDSNDWRTDLTSR